VIAAKKKGINILERGHQVNAMAEFQEMLGFAPDAEARRARKARTAPWSGRAFGRWKIGAKST
jgi:hypothetical protein